MGSADVPDYRGAGASGTLTEQNWNVIQFSHTAGTIEGPTNQRDQPQEFRFSKPARLVNA
jgi:hypothetical protein